MKIEKEGKDKEKKGKVTGWQEGRIQKSKCKMQKSKVGGV
jgi:hypothetical protein